MVGGTWQSAASDRNAALNLTQIASVLVVLPVFLQAPWVRLHPFSAVLFTAVLVGTGVVMNRSNNGRQDDLGALLVGFSGSWLAGCLFWGWLRAHPLVHLPIEAFALPLALAGLRTRWKLAAGFYLASLIGTACTDLMMAVTGVMKHWPVVVTAPLGEASALLHQAGLSLFNPAAAVALIGAAAGLIGVARRCHEQANQGGANAELWSMVGVVLSTTVWVDGLFLAAALLQPNLSGLI